ncbi:hypothetical protein C8K63_102234 [Pseudomonas sp. GV085]|nr:hypothetical protein C8K63_102234 [Pseudomonas sp. GV085]
MVGIPGAMLLAWQDSFFAYWDGLAEGIPRRRIAASSSHLYGAQ